LRAIQVKFQFQVKGSTKSIADIVPKLCHTLKGPRYRSITYLVSLRLLEFKHSN